VVGHQIVLTAQEVALCGNCFKPPNMRRYAGRKRTREVVTGEDESGHNHQDMYTLRSFEAPSVLTEKYRDNPLKHFQQNVLTFETV
jgi:hypothetical protein